MTSFILKINKAYLQSPTISFTLKIITLKSILTNLKIPNTVFLLILFSNVKKAYLRIPKYLAQFFCLFPFSNIKKAYSQILAQVFAYSFSNIKKAYLQISKYLAQFFCLFHFSNIKKAYLWISKYSFHTNNNFKGNNLHKKPIIWKIFIKTIIQIDKHKVEYIITVCIPKLL